MLESKRITWFASSYSAFHPKLEREAKFFGNTKKKRTETASGFSILRRPNCNWRSGLFQFSSVQFSCRFFFRLHRPDFQTLLTYNEPPKLLILEYPYTTTKTSHKIKIIVDNTVRGRHWTAYIPPARCQAKLDIALFWHTWLCVVFESPVQSGFFAIFGTVEAIAKP